ncbi:MAG: rRNA maturation RNase YbeY [Chloroflexi bacterium]|nr:rRNA maturation RNase YbeY [Chloroflexota bacterium]
MAHAMMAMDVLATEFDPISGAVIQVSNSPIRKIDITLDQLVNLAATETWLRMVMELALYQALPSNQPAQVSLVLTDDATIQDLNRKYRGLDEVTDVLSFSAEFPGHWEGDGDTAGSVAETAAGSGTESIAVTIDGDGLISGPGSFIMPPDQVPPLGEVIISHPQAQRQAAEKAVDIDRELALLVVHGVLHLLGHDHLGATDTALMQSKEQAALQTIFSVGVSSP